MLTYILLYVATLVVMLPLDLLFLGVLAKGFFQAQAGQHIAAEPNMVAAAAFYLLYPAAIVTFANGNPAVTWQSALLFGALLGLTAYATFDLTTLALFKTWTWPAAIVDMIWGSFVTATSAALGLLLARWAGKLL